MGKMVGEVVNGFLGMLLSRGICIHMYINVCISKYIICIRKIHKCMYVDIVGGEESCSF